MAAFERAVFGNHDGSHQLLDSSLSASDPVLSELRFLVDRPAGHVGPEVTWSPYWGCQRVDRWWVLWRGEEDFDAPRKNMVTARVVLVPVDQCSKIDTLDELFPSVGFDPEQNLGRVLNLAGRVADWLANGRGPAIVSGISVAPLVLAVLWPCLWTRARASFSLRTLFGAESIGTVSPSSIVVIPEELRQRWHGLPLIAPKDTPDGLAARWFMGKQSAYEERLVKANKDSLPGEFTVLNRIERIARCLKPLHIGTGTLTDTLMVVRTQEAFSEGFELAPEDQLVITSALDGFDRASIQDVRAASLVTLDAIPQLGAVEAALARWVEKSLPEQSTEDALWILKQQAGETHVPWWRRAVGTGLDTACHAKNKVWATAIWRWWHARPEIVFHTTGHLARTHETEQWLARNAPANVECALFRVLAEVCRERKWATLFARALGSTRPLLSCVESLRQNLPNPEEGLDVLLLDRDAGEIVDTATATCWPPLLKKAVSSTVANPQFLVITFGSPGFLPLFVRHLSQGGVFPTEFLRADFLQQVFDGVIEGNPDYLSVVKYLDRKAGPFFLDHPECERLVSCVNSELVQGAAEEWWSRFLSDESVRRPTAALWSHVYRSSLKRLEGMRITLVMGFLRLAPEIPEADFVEWLTDTGFRWESEDHKRMADLVVQREWKTAANKFRWSWKRELNLVAWYAQNLLPSSDRFSDPPEGVDLPKDPSGELRKKMVLLFLAANPLSSEKLTLDEEARDIEKKVRDSKHRDLVLVKTHWAVQPEDLQQVLLEHKPTIVHFSGHGCTGGIVLHSINQQDERIVDAEALTGLFRALKDEIRVVVLNACFSEAQAREIVKEIDFVVGMSESIEDNAARVFAAAFYRGLAFGRSVKKAFKLGINELRLVGLSHEVSVPKLLVRRGVDAKSTCLVAEG